MLWRLGRERGFCLLDGPKLTDRRGKERSDSAERRLVPRTYSSEMELKLSAEMDKFFKATRQIAPLDSEEEPND